MFGLWLNLKVYNHILECLSGTGWQIPVSFWTPSSQTAIIQPEIYHAFDVRVTAAAAAASESAPCRNKVVVAGHSLVKFQLGSVSSCNADSLICISEGYKSTTIKLEFV